jgi:hypothetical protein
MNYNRHPKGKIVSRRILNRCKSETKYSGELEWVNTPRGTLDTCSRFLTRWAQIHRIPLGICKLILQYTEVKITNLPNVFDLLCDLNYFREDERYLFPWHRTQCSFYPAIYSLDHVCKSLTDKELAQYLDPIAEELPVLLLHSMNINDWSSCSIQVRIVRVLFKLTQIPKCLPSRHQNRHTIQDLAHFWCGYHLVFRQGMEKVLQILNKNKSS